MGSQTTTSNHKSNFVAFAQPPTLHSRARPALPQNIGLKSSTLATDPKSVGDVVAIAYRDQQIVPGGDVGVYDTVSGKVNTSHNLQIKYVSHGDKMTVVPDADVAQMKV